MIAISVVPGAPLHTYVVSCQYDTCEPTDECIVNAIDKAIKDGVKVISMSLGYDTEVAQKFRHPGNDVVGLELLHAIEKEVLTIVSIGNEGPIKGSAVCCRPWTMTVGACTNGNILETIVEIAIKYENEGFMLLYTRLKVLLSEFYY